MSSQGRFRDALWDILDGYENGDGTFTAGPLHELKAEELRVVFDDIEHAAGATIGHHYEGVISKLREQVAEQEGVIARLRARVFS